MGPTLLQFGALQIKHRLAIVCLLMLVLRLLAGQLGAGAVHGAVNRIGGQGIAHLSAVASPVASPVAATPNASPVAAGCGNAASSSTEVAEAFVAAALHDDLTRAAGCMAPGYTARGWDDVFFSSLDGAAAVTGCRDQPYTVYVSRVAPATDSVIFDFGAPCVVAQLDESQSKLYHTDILKVPVLIVQLDHDGDRWYVRDALASVPD